MNADSTPIKQVPVWYTQKSLCEAEVDLRDFGDDWGVFPLRDPPSAMQGKWWAGVKDAKSVLEPEILGLHLQANYGGPDEASGKWPARNAKSQEWVNTAKNLPSKIALRIMNGANRLASDGADDDAGN